MAAESVYIGIDPTAGKRLMTYAVLDGSLNVLAVADANFEGVLKVADSYAEAVCAIDGPSAPGTGLMASPAYREGLGLPPKSKTYSTFRVGEYELRRRKIGLYRTPRNADDAPGWMKVGWKLYAALQEAGYVQYPQSGERRMCEVHPHACFTVLLGKRPYKKDSFEGRLQRQLLLYEEGVEIDDPMQVMEEWTRHRVLTGELGLDGVLHGHDVLDAVVAAYTAYLMAEEPGRTSWLGDPDEGRIVVPVAGLEDAYL